MHIGMLASSNYQLGDLSLKGPWQLDGSIYTTSLQLMLSKNQLSVVSDFFLIIFLNWLNWLKKLGSTIKSSSTKQGLRIKSSNSIHSSLKQLSKFTIRPNTTSQFKSMHAYFLHLLTRRISKVLSPKERLSSIFTDQLQSQVQ